MPRLGVYHRIRQLLNQWVDEEVSVSSRERLALLVLGIIYAKHAAPARIAQALRSLRLSGATAESIERRIRRVENDPQILARLCVHPVIRELLKRAHPERILLIMDPTCQDDRLVMVSAAIWYRGRALPLAWVTWPGNEPLQGLRFWARVRQLLEQVASILPAGVSVTWLADRAFGTSAFTDMLAEYGWHYVVRVQGQTRCRTCMGREQLVERLVAQQGERAKLRGEVFKSRGWRQASVVVYWSGRCATPLCLISDLPPQWSLIRLYRRRYAIEASFRHYKTYGWCWEQGQVTNRKHVQRLLVGMALATWVALMVGTQVASELLAQAPTGRRRTRPWSAKRSLFGLGLEHLMSLLHSDIPITIDWVLADWEAPNWEDQITQHHRYAYVFTLRPRAVAVVQDS